MNQAKDELGSCCQTLCNKQVVETYIESLEKCIASQEVELMQLRQENSALKMKLEIPLDDKEADQLIKKTSKHVHFKDISGDLN